MKITLGKLAQFNSMPGSRSDRIFWHSRVKMTDSNNNNNNKSNNPFLHFNQRPLIKKKPHNSLLTIFN